MRPLHDLSDYLPAWTMPQECMKANSFAVHQSSGLYCNMHITNCKNSSFFSPPRFSSDPSKVKPCGMHTPAIQFPNRTSISFRRYFRSQSHLHHRRILYSALLSLAYPLGVIRASRLTPRDELWSGIAFRLDRCRKRGVYPHRGPKSVHLGQCLISPQA
jgi:hypothetical protein